MGENIASLLVLKLAIKGPVKPLNALNLKWALGPNLFMFGAIHHDPTITCGWAQHELDFDGR